MPRLVGPSMGLAGPSKESPGHLQGHGSRGAGASLGQVKQTVEAGGAEEGCRIRWVLEVQEDNSRLGTEGLEVAGDDLGVLKEPSGVVGPVALAVVEGELSQVRLVLPVS